MEAMHAVDSFSYHIQNEPQSHCKIMTASHLPPPKCGALYYHRMASYFFPVNALVRALMFCGTSMLCAHDVYNAGILLSNSSYAMVHKMTFHIQIFSATTMNPSSFNETQLNGRSIM